jgi:hypothetical protein
MGCFFSLALLFQGSNILQEEASHEKYNFGNPDSFSGYEPGNVGM